jgi:hypothetical protein
MNNKRNICVWRLFHALVSFSFLLLFDFLVGLLFYLQDALAQLVHNYYMIFSRGLSHEPEYTCYYLREVWFEDCIIYYLFQVLKRPELKSIENLKMVSDNAPVIYLTSFVYSCIPSNTKARK